MWRGIGVCLMLYVGMAAAIWIVIHRLHPPTLQRLADEGVRTDALVIATACHQRFSVRYRFEVRGRTVEGSGSPGAGNPPCDQLRAGDRISVWYVPDAPNINGPAAPSIELKRSQGSAVAATVILPAVMVIGLVLAARRRERDRARQSLKG